jgi:hypothetical protein
MKQFKRSLLALAAVFTLALGACTDPCADADCGTYGSCTVVGEEGICLCTNGYEQNADGKCEVRSTAKFAGLWRATETCNDIVNGGSFNFTYDVTITESAPEVTRIIMAGLGDLTCANNTKVAPEATIEAETSLSINANTYCEWQFVNTSATVNKGTFNDKGNTNAADDEITLVYRVKTTAGTTPAQEFECTVTLVRK